jgi:hypothetical protein
MKTDSTLLFETASAARATGDAPPSKMLTTEEAAQLLGLSPRTLERRRSAQRPILPHITPTPGRVRYALTDVLRHLEASRSTPNPIPTQV